MTITGEWSNAITDCAKWLNGRNVGARWDGTYSSGQQTIGSCDGMTGNMSTFSADYKAFLRKYVPSPSLPSCGPKPGCLCVGTGKRRSLWARAYKAGYFGRGR